MSLTLQAQDFRRLTELLRDQPEFGTAQGRRRLVSAALEGAQQSRTILGRLNLEGPPLSAAVETVRVLQTFGQVAYGQEALGVLLNYLVTMSGGNDRRFLTGILQKYSLDASVTGPHTVTRWRADSDEASIQETIFGEDSLWHIRTLELALDAARAVVRVRVRSRNGVGLGTGFMISPQLMMTNHHVMPSLEKAHSAEITFNFQLDLEGVEREAVTTSILHGGKFYTSEALDISVVQITPTSFHFAPLLLRTNRLSHSDRLAIIQHPGGHLKKISMQKNFVAYADEDIVQYTTCTLPGSSGSPVMDASFSVVAVHHTGGPVAEPMTQISYLRNEGTSMIAILRDLSAHAPDIHTELRIQ